MTSNLLRTLRLATVFAGYTLLVVTVLCVSCVSVQAQSNRVLHVTVTDHLGRFVTGIEQEHFEIVANGIRQTITGFSDVDSAISVAIVGETQIPDLGFKNPGDELIQTRSVPEALRQLSASKNLRKALVVTTAVDRQAIPTGIQVVQTHSEDVFKAVVEIRNEYVLQFESSNTSAGVEVVLKQPRGLPALQANLK
jgi:hypothetical protein